MERTPLEVALALSALAVAFYAVAAPFVVSPFPPMTDLPFHAAHASTLRHYLDPSFHLREQFELHPMAVPYLSMYVIAAVLMLVLPALTAVKVAAAIMVGLVPAGLAVLFHGMKKSPLLGLLGLGLCWCNLTHWGFLNFVGALGLFAMTLGLTMRLVDRPSRGGQWALGLTLVALFFTHIFRYPFAIAAVIGTAVVLYPATRRIRPIVAPLLPAIGLLLAWMAARPKAIAVDPGPVELHKVRLNEFVHLLSGAFTDGADQVALDTFFKVAFGVAVVSLIVAAASLLLKIRRPTPWTWDVGVTLVVASCAAVFLVLFLTLPMQMGVWWYVYPREATATAIVALGLFPDLPRPLALRVPLVAALGFSGLGVTGVVVKNYRQFASVTRDFAAITEEIPKAPKLLYLVFDHNGSTRTTTPFIHLPAYVQAQKGGWLSFHFAVWGSSPITYRPREEAGAVVPPPTPLRWEWTPEVFDVHRQGRFFDWFLIRRRTAPDGLFAADPTIERVDHIGTWWLYRRRPAG